MKKILLAFLSIIIITFAFSSCGIKKVANEEQLMNMLISQFPESLQRNYDDGEENDVKFEIKNFTIERRQTNKEEKTDKVDCLLDVDNEDYSGVFNYTLYLNYYDEGGWQLDNYSRKEKDVVKPKRSTVPKNVTDTETFHYQNYFGEMIFSEEIFDEETGNVTRTYSVDNQYPYMSAKGTFSIIYEFREEGEEGWRSWIPTYENNVKQEWNFNGTYVYDAEPQEYIWQSDYSAQVPKICDANNSGEDIYMGINSISVVNFNDKSIEFELEIITRDYDGGFHFDSFSNEKIDFDIAKFEYNKRIFSNRDKDYMNLVIDRERGLYVEKYSYENNKKYYYNYIGK